MREGWTTKQLGDLCTIRPPKNETRTKLDDNAEVGFLPMEGLGIRQQAVTTSQTRTLGNVYKGYTYFADGDVLLAKITPCFQNGKLGIARDLPNGVGFGSSEYFVLRSNGEVLPEYLFYFLSQDSFTEGGVRQMSGAVGHQRVPPEYVASQEIPLPPLAEQKRIVTILDEAFEAIERAENLASEAIELVGKLGDAGQRALIDSLREKYTSTKLEAVCSRITVGHVGSMKTRYVAKGIPFLRSTNIKPFRISMDDLVFIDDVFHAELGKSALTPGMVAVVRTGEPGVAAVVPDELPIANCSDLVIIHPGPSLCPEYVCVVLNSAFGKALVGSRLVGAAQKHFNVTEAKRIELPLPPMGVQVNIAEKAQRERELAEMRIRLDQQRLQLLGRLRASLLGSAFRGDLSATDRASEEFAEAIA